MAQTIYLPDGTYELVTGYPAEVLRRIIRDRLGPDCEQLYSDVLMPNEALFDDDYEEIADEYRQMLHETVEELEALISYIDSAKRTDYKTVRRNLVRIHRGILKNL